MSKIPHKSLCRICGRRPADTREHVPPQATGNRGKARVYFILGNSTPEEKNIRTQESDDGLWVPTLCEVCNNKTGAQFVEPYADFVRQVSNAPGVLDASCNTATHLKQIYPLRVLKQMYCMFLAATPFEPTEVWRGIQEFVLKRDAPLPKIAPSVFVYHNLSSVGRLAPICLIMSFGKRLHHQAAEISWPPVGLVFSFEGKERLKFMQDVTSWANFSFHDRIDVAVSLPRLQVYTPYPLTYGTSRDVEEEQAKLGLAYSYHVPEGYEGPAGMGAIWTSVES